jgi:hypothetical protein
MFKIKAASEVPGAKQRVIVGSPDNTYPDIVFSTDFSRDIILSMNSVVLRTALLNSIEFLEKNLKIKIVDLVNVKVEKPKTVAKEPTQTKGAKKLEWK